MSKGKFILVNGSFVPSEEYRISAEEAEAPYFSEQFRAVKTSFPFFDATLEIIKLKHRLFNQTFPGFTEENGAGMKREMERTLTKNKHFIGAKLTLTFRFLNGKINYTIQSETTKSAAYELNEKGLFAELFDKIQKPASSLSSLSLGSTAYWEIAESHRSGSSADEFIISGTSGAILEIPSANIYVIKGKMVRSASAGDGAYIDVTKPLMLHIFRQLNLEYSEDEEITSEDIKTAEEVFVVNAIEGIRWIIGIGGKRYFNNTTRKISDLFNQLVVS